MSNSEVSKFNIAFKPSDEIEQHANTQQSAFIARQLTWDIPQFNDNAMSLFRMGEHGTCREVIKVFPFPTQ